MRFIVYNPCEMTVLIIILSVLLWIGAFVAFPKKIQLSPSLSYCALLLLSFAKSSDGTPILPLTFGMNMSWLTITLIVMMIIVLQNPALRVQSRGTLYILFGALAGMSVGLIGYTFSSSLNLLYGTMIVATAAGTALGLLVFTNTPDGRNIAPGTGNFLKYLLAKGFPALVTVAQLGVAAIIIIATRVIA